MYAETHASRRTPATTAQIVVGDSGIYNGHMEMANLWRVVFVLLVGINPTKLTRYTILLRACLHHRMSVKRARFA